MAKVPTTSPKSPSMMACGVMAASMVLEIFSSSQAIIIPESSKTDFSMALEKLTLHPVVIMKGNSLKAKNKAMVSLSQTMARSIQENGSMISERARESVLRMMEKYTKGSGATICMKVRVYYSNSQGMAKLNIKVPLKVI